MVSNSSRSTLSNPAALTVDGLPSITTQPANQTVNVGQTATFTVVATGAAPLSYQWQKNQVNIAGATSASLHDASHDKRRQRNELPCDRDESGHQRDQQCGDADGEHGPSITTQPANQTVNVGQTATFTVVATGAPL